MKTYKIFKNIIVYSLTILIVASCSDVLEEEPVGLLAPESFFQSENDLEAAVLGIYTVFGWQEMYGRHLPMTLITLGDACDIANLGTVATRVQKNNFEFDANDGNINGAWQGLYQAIGAANSAINGAGIVKKISEQKRNELLAEAMIGRAHCYYQLVQLFGDIPFIEDFVTDPNSVSEISKTSTEEIYQHIISDCEFAAQNLPDNYTDDIRCRPTKGTAKTMLASVHLTLGNYAEAAQYAEDVISNASTYGYGLTENFSDLWIAENGDMPEHIWTVDFESGNNQNTREYWTPWTVPGEIKGWNVLCPSPGLYDLYDPEDHRIEATFLSEIVNDGDTIPYTEWQYPRYFWGKYTHPSSSAASDGTNNGYNYSLYRFSEVYLIAAEALAEANNGPTAKAYEYINKVRERARFGGTFPEDLETGMSKENFIDAVLKERLLEFPLEFKRWYDIKRRQLGNEAFKGANSIEPHATFDASKHYLMPIPQDELDRNTNLLPQNTGY